MHSDPTRDSGEEQHNAAVGFNDELGAIHEAKSRQVIDAA